MHIVRKEYQGKHSLEGNQCSQFLQKVDTLERDIMNLSDDLIISALPVVETLRAFRGVKESCFGNDLLPDYKEKIERFSKSYRSLNISPTPKVFYYYY